MQFAILSPEHPDRLRAEDSIREIYRTHYDARLSTFAPNLAVLYGRDRRILCAAGMRLPSDRFFSESYLEGPVEKAASDALSRPVGRREIVEISTLASVRKCATGHFLAHFVNGSRAIGTSLLLFTATARLRTYLRRNGVELVELCAATPGCLRDADEWGSYYANDPKVCLTPDTITRPFGVAPQAPFSGPKFLEAA